MARNSNILFLYHLVITICLLVFVSLGFLVVWTLFLLQEPREGRRPGIDIREL